MLRLPLVSCCSERTFHYLTILLFQLHRIWDIWSIKDLTIGDTAQYFYDAVLWHETFQNRLAWSPLYTAYYGAFAALSEHPYVATTVHRIVLVLGLAVVALAIFRRLLPAPAAWLMAAWWCVLPVNFSTLYEVHLFSTLPALISLWIVLKYPALRGRAAALGILIASIVLVRNEYAVIAILFGLYCLIADSRSPGAGVRYATACGCALLVSAFFYWRSVLPNPELLQSFERKHRLNVCQIYAYGYQQRHPEHTDSPWNQCERLMQRTFGAPRPSLLEAIDRNPAAMREHFIWNISLIPAGLEVLLFNISGFDVSPDYVSVYRLRVAHLFGAGAMLLYGFGLVWLVRNRRRTWVRHATAFGPAAALSLAILFTGLLVSVMQRPRPAYLFACSVVLLGLLAMSGKVLLWRPPLSGAVERLFPALACLVVLVVPSHYNLERFPERRLLGAYEKLLPHQELFARPVRLMTTEFAPELCAYLARRRRVCIPVDYDSVRPAPAETMSLAEFLTRSGADLCFVSPGMMAEPFLQPWLSDPARFGWRVAGSDVSGRARWMVLKKSP